MFKSIRHQFILLNCTLVIFAIVLSLSVSYYLISSGYAKNIQQTNAILAESLAANIAQFMQNAYNLNAQVAINGDMVNGDKENKKSILEHMVKRYPFFQLLASHTLNGDQTARSSGVLANRADRWWFKEFINKKKSYITKSYYSVAGNMAVTTAVNGMYRENKLVGVMMADIETSTLQKMVEKYNFGAGSYAYLLDGEGIVVAHPDKEQVAELFNYKTQKKIILKKDSQGHILRDIKGNELTEEVDFAISATLKNIINKVINGETGVGEYTDINGDAYFCAYRSVSMPGNSSPWNLVMVQKKSSALAFINNVATKNIIIGVVVILISALFSYWFSKKITGPLFVLQQELSILAQKGGDLTQEIKIDSKNELGDLAKAVNQFLSNLRIIISKVRHLSGEVACASERLSLSSEQSAQSANQVAVSITEMAQGAKDQRDAAKNTFDVVQEISASIQQIAIDVNEVSSQSKQAVNSAENGDKAVERAVSQMNRIEETVDVSARVISKLGDRSKEIGQIVNTIHSIADQTNLLALNAAIEAARAGEHGRGFAVVAEEVRQLAEQAQKATKQISDLIGEIQSDTDDAVLAMSTGTKEVRLGADVVSATGESFREISLLVSEVSRQVIEISKAIEQMSAGSQQIVGSAQEIDQLSKTAANEAQNVSAATEEQLASMEEIASSSEGLSKLAVEMQSVIEKFKV